MRVVSTIIWAILALVFAAAAGMMALFTIGTTELLAYAFILVFVLGSIVAARSARDAFARRGRNNASA